MNKNSILKPLLIFLFIVFCAHSSKAQDEEETTNTTTAITPFTGVDYVRVVFNKQLVSSPANTFKATIRAVANGKLLWQGPVSPKQAVNEGGNHLAFTISNIKPVLWTPNNPYLYEITLQQLNKGAVKQTWKERAGFRSFERKGGNLYLNGKPIFLRGIAINPPGRGIPAEVERSRAFALDYVKFMKSINVNIIRIPDAEEWFDVCDELGMMVFGGNYSGKVAGGEKVEAQAKVGDETDGGFPSDHNRGVSWYQNEKLGAIAHHPSLMVYAMTNETPFAGKRGEAWEKFLDYAYNKLKQWDETRVYIANAGYGYGKTGDITDIHRYWGWYYSSPFTFLNIRDEALINPYAGKHQPITFTECVGNYTGPDGRYNLTPAHKNPSSQLAWTGHAAQALQAQLADYHQSFTLRQATESFRQLRPVNPDLSGVFPFTILFYNWNTVQKFADMKPKPVTEQVKISYQPVLLSWECWTPNVYAGSSIKPIAHIINDANDFSDLTKAKMVYELRDKAHQVVFTDSISLNTVPYYSTVSKTLEIKVPADITTGNYELIGKVFSGNMQVSQNYYRLFIAGKLYNPAVTTSSVILYDKQGTTRKALNELRIPFSEATTLDAIAPASVLVIGENSADENLGNSAEKIKAFIASGGRVVALRQDSLHLPNINRLLINPVTNFNVDIDDPRYPLSVRSPRNGYYVNPERPDHPVFAGITRDNLRVWSDYSAWNATQKGFPKIKPVTDGFNLINSDDVANTAILANYGSGLQAIAMAEQFQGSGSILLCGLDIANRAGFDPVASRMFINLVNYSNSAAGHDRYQLVTSPIIWGEYETEKGIVTDLYSGFLVNSTPRVPKDYMGKGIVVTKEGYQLAGGARSGFNTRPGIQYVANGRRPFGPFAQSFGGQPHPLDLKAEGVGKFWCRVPEGHNTATSVVWNPGKEPLVMKVKVNGQEESHTIAAGEKKAIESRVNSSDVNIVFTGDRRLVVLETAFSRK